MAYVDNHRDLNKIKDKPIYGFTIRQIISFGVVIITGIPIYAIMLSKKMDVTLACLVICLMAIPIFYVGTYEDVFGRPLERILRDKLRLIYRTKSKRPYSTDNSYEAIKNQRMLERKYRELARKELVRKKKLAQAKRKKKTKTSVGIKGKKKELEKTA